MRLAYFDENKYAHDNPYFVIGGVLIQDIQSRDIEKTLTQIQFNFFDTSTLAKETEFHGKDLLHGKGNFKRRKIHERIQVFHDLCSVAINYKLPVRIVAINVKAHLDKYTYPMPEYRLGLMLILERFCDYLDQVKDVGLVFGDFEKDEIAGSVLDFSQFKVSGSTPMYGRPLGRLIDTVYFTQSHHSRFLQLADVIIYLASRYEIGGYKASKWHDLEANEAWKKLKASVDLKIQRWP